MTEKNLQDYAAIVTGGAQGIGGSISRRLADEGCRTLIVDVDEEAGRRQARSIEEQGGTAIVMTADVSDSGVAQAMTGMAMSKWGRLDILVQNAYGVVSNKGDGSALSVEEDIFDAGMALLTRAHYLGAKYAIPAMEESGTFPGWEGGPWQGAGLRSGQPPAENVGRIVNISSVHGVLQAPNSIVYETGKAAVIGMTRQMAIDFGPLGITVNVIAPGHIVTEKLEELWKTSSNEAGFHLFELQYPVRRTGVPEDIANAVSFLCSPQSSFVTGHLLTVDGGLSIQLQENLVMDTQNYIQGNPDLRTYFDDGRGEPRK